MKKTILYIVFILLLFLLMYWINKDAPVNYRWTPTYSKSDKQPFGAYAFDKILSASWEEGYSQSYESIWDLEEQEVLDDYNILIIAKDLYMYEEEEKVLLDYIQRGGNALLIANYFSGELQDTLNITTTYGYNYIYNYVLNSENQQHSNIRFCSEELKNQEYSFPSVMCQYHFEPFDTIKSIYADSMYIISETKDSLAVSLRYQIGEGNLILACNPLIFTNYGVLNDSINNYIWNHLAYLKGRPLLRTEYYEAGSQGGNEDSEMRVILDNRSLKWAYYLTLISILIFMIFTAKRKQKPIPVIKPPVNNMLAFVKSIASLYLQRNNNADIILKKQIYWAEDLKRKYGIDIINEPHDWDFYTRVASKTQKPVNDVRRLFVTLSAIDENTVVSDEEMMDIITKINDI